jgi:hypothetical protein
MKARTRIRLGRIALALAALVISGVVVSGSGSSTNYELDQETNPTVAQDAWSPNHRLIGAIPGSPSGEIGISAQYRMHFDDLTPTSFLPDDLIPPVITVAPTVTYISSTVALIEWQTDEPSDGTVEFGLTPAFGTTASHSGFATLHQVHITTGLAPSTFYFFKARSTDPYANGPTWSTLLDFTTTGTPDTTGPVVTPTVTFLATTVAKVDFVIDEMSQTVLNHGPTIAMGTTETDPTWLIARSRTFTGVTAGSTYYYSLDATDPSGNTTVGAVTGINMPADVAITTTLLPNGKVKKNYLETLMATGGVGALTFSLASGTLPPGLILAANGEISGKATKAGTYLFVVQVDDSGTPVSTTTANLQITIAKDGGGDDGGCTSGEQNGIWMLLAAIAAMALVLRRRFSQAS